MSGFFLLSFIYRQVDNFIAMLCNAVEKRSKWLLCTFCCILQMERIEEDQAEEDEQVNVR